MDSAQPFFSVIVPTYNQAQYLGQALDSLIAQSDPYWEAVVVDDGSTDQTASVLNVYRAMDARIRVVSKENGGTGSALNEGLRQARGEWICWLSSDDLFDVRKLEVHRREIARNPGGRFFYTYARAFEDVTGQYIDQPIWLPNASSNWQVLNMLAANFISGNSICVRRAEWERVGAFDESLRYAQDYDMWLQLIFLFPAVLIPEWTCYTRLHASQGTYHFSEAGWYDASKSAIRFLNRHPFTDVMQMIDLNDPNMSRKAVVKALFVASNLSGSMYALGSHPALLGRIVEWAWEPYAQRSRSVEQRIIRAWAATIGYLYQGTTFGMMWQDVVTAADLNGAVFCYEQVSPVKVAKAYYLLLRATTSSRVIPLRQYLEKFENLQFPDEPDLAFEMGKQPRGTDNETVASTKQQWRLANILILATRCPTLLREPLWWILVARSTTLGSTVERIAGPVAARIASARDHAHKFIRQGRRLLQLCVASVN